MPDGGFLIRVSLSWTDCRISRPGVDFKSFSPPDAVALPSGAFTGHLGHPKRVIAAPTRVDWTIFAKL